MATKLKQVSYEEIRNAFLLGNISPLKLHQIIELMMITNKDEFLKKLKRALKKNIKENGNS